ncbi:MAG TPA: type II toxin-antitoxin system VapC family toxin [Caulobacteraceae bacterium]|nr:type II toxin-antitoxin system VapC family toxin [Caulobacteraceae bacterium]
MIVLDASAALASVLESQATAAADAFFGAPPSTLIAPAIFSFEVRNALLHAERRGLIDADLVDETSLHLAAAVELWPLASRPADFVRLLNLARREVLSLFDAAYLDLARSEAASLASRDGPLIEAARRIGVRIHDLR